MKWFRLSYIHKIAIHVSENYISEKISMKKTLKNYANKKKFGYICFYDNVFQKF